VCILFISFASLVSILGYTLLAVLIIFFFFFFQAEDGIRDFHVTGVQTCALPISPSSVRCWRALLPDACAWISPGSLRASFRWSGDSRPRQWTTDPRGSFPGIGTARAPRP